MITKLRNYVQHQINSIGESSNKANALLRELTTLLSENHKLLVYMKKLEKAENFPLKASILASEGDCLLFQKHLIRINSGEKNSYSLFVEDDSCDSGYRELMSTFDKKAHLFENTFYLEVKLQGFLDSFRRSMLIGNVA